MWDLADEAKRLGIADLFDTEPEQIRDALADGRRQRVDLADEVRRLPEGATAGAPRASPTSTSRRGSRTRRRRSARSATSSPMDERHDFEQAARPPRTPSATRRSTPPARSSAATTLGAFNELLAINQVANFAWWNEDHNYYIDLRASIPMRRGALALGAGRRRRHATTTRCSSSSPSSSTSAAGAAQWKDLQSIATARHEYYDHYQDIRDDASRRSSARCPSKIEDPVLIEIFGMHHHYFEGLKADADADRCSTASRPRRARTPGRARVMVSATELFDLEEGEILVCEATSPNWTPAFAIIAACVCDGGGSLTHAAIVSREYGIPCVVGTSVATLADQDRRPHRGRRHQGHRHDPRARQLAPSWFSWRGRVSETRTRQENRLTRGGRRRPTGGRCPNLRPVSPSTRSITPRAPSLGGKEARAHHPCRS